MMTTAATRVRIFLASSSDVTKERDQLANVVEEINTTLSALAPHGGVFLELVRWETHVHPGLGRDAQGVVNDQIREYDIFVGVMWRRFGTPTAVAGSGTEEEFRIAQRAWENNRRLFQILFYFSQEHAAPPSTSEDVDQLGRVVAFRQELSSAGLVWDYEGSSTFADTVRPHLVMVLGRMLHGDAPLAAVTAVPRKGDDDDLARRDLTELAGEYERLRETMPPGDERTRRMEIVASRLRSFALSFYPLVDELTFSDSAGRRLAAVTTLQAIPDVKYVQWLGERMAVERPFVGYHAAVALLSAARALDAAELPKVRTAVRVARASRLSPDTDRDITLSLVEQELGRRTGSS